MVIDAGDFKFEQFFMKQQSDVISLAFKFLLSIPLDRATASSDC